MDKATANLWHQVRQAYAEGYSDVEVMRLMRVTKARFYELMAESDDFREFVEMGRVLSEAWWMEQGRTNLKPKQGERFDTALFTFMTKNRFGWSEKLGVNDKADLDSLTSDAIAGKIHTYMKDHAKKFGTDPAMSEVLSGLSN